MLLKFTVPVQPQRLPPITWLDLDIVFIYTFLFLLFLSLPLVFYLVFPFLFRMPVARHFSKLFIDWPEKGQKNVLEKTTTFFL